MNRKSAAVLVFVFIGAGLTGVAYQYDQFIFAPDNSKPPAGVTSIDPTEVEITQTKQETSYRLSGHVKIAGTPVSLTGLKLRLYDDTCSLRSTHHLGDHTIDEKRQTKLVHTNVTVSTLPQYIAFDFTQMDGETTLHIRNQDLEPPAERPQNRSQIGDYYDVDMFSYYYSQEYEYNITNECQTAQS